MIPNEMQTAWTLQSLGVALTLEDYEERLPAVVAEDMLQIRRELKPRG